MITEQGQNQMDVVIKFNKVKNRFEGFVDGKMVSRSRHESYVKDQLAKLGFMVGSNSNNVTQKVDEFGINKRFEFVEQMVSMVSKKTIASAIITGLDRIDQAIRSRALCVDLSMTQEQKVERMEVLVESPEFLEEYEIADKRNAIAFIREHKDSVANLSLRTLIATTKIAAEGGDWKQLAKYVMTQGA